MNLTIRNSPIVSNRSIDQVMSKASGKPSSEKLKSEELPQKKINSDFELSLGQAEEMKQSGESMKVDASDEARSVEREENDASSSNIPSSLVATESSPLPELKGEGAKQSVEKRDEMESRGSDVELAKLFLTKTVASKLNQLKGDDQVSLKNDVAGPVQGSQIDLRSVPEWNDQKSEVIERKIQLPSFSQTNSLKSERALVPHDFIQVEKRENLPFGSMKSEYSMLRPEEGELGVSVDSSRTQSAQVFGLPNGMGSVQTSSFMMNAESPVRTKKEGQNGEKREESIQLGSKIEARPTAELSFSGSDFVETYGVANAKKVSSRETESREGQSFKMPEYDLEGGKSTEQTLPPAFMGVKPDMASTRSNHLIKKVEVDAQVTQGSMMTDRLSSASLQNISAGLQKMISGAGGEMKIRLKPEGMGELNLSVKTRGNDVSLKVLASNQQAKEILEQSVSSLKESLAQKNLQFGKIDFGLTPQSSVSGLSQADSSNMGSEMGLNHSGGYQTYLEHQNEQRGGRSYERADEGSSDSLRLPSSALTHKATRPDYSGLGSGRLDLLA